jgi:hypothetical protein
MGRPTSMRQRSIAASIESAKQDPDDAIQKPVASRLCAQSSRSETRQLPTRIVLDGRMLNTPIRAQVTILSLPVAL